MGFVLITPSTEEPITRAEAKTHLRLDTGDYTLAEDVCIEQATLTTDTNGASSSVAAYDVTAILELNTITSSWIFVKLQDSPDASTWTDVAGSTTWTLQGSTTTAGSFVAANSNTTYQQRYTGTQPYLRGVVTFSIGASANLALRFVKNARYTDENTLIDRLITAARRRAENYLNRRFVTQTWDWMLDEAPTCDSFRLPWPPLQSITHIKYLPTDGSTLASYSSTNYHVATPTNQPAYVKLNPGSAWPSVIDKLDSFQIRMVLGYGAASAVPDTIKQAVCLMVGSLYKNRAATDQELMSGGVRSLLDSERWG